MDNLPEQIVKRIEEDAKIYARDHSAAPDKETPDWIISDYKSGATSEAKRALVLLEALFEITKIAKNRGITTGEVVEIYNKAIASYNNPKTN